MSDFYDQILVALDETKNSDRSLICKPAMEIQFGSGTVRLWGGTGTAITPDGNEWVGWHNGDIENPQEFISIPQIEDPRSGNSPVYDFELGYIDEVQYKLLREDNSKEQVDGRKLLLGNIYFIDQSMIAATNLGDITRLTMRGQASFSEKIAKRSDGGHRYMRKAGVKAVNINSGRSQLNFSTWTDTGQKFRSEQIHGVSNDLYAQFIARYAGGVVLER